MEAKITAVIEDIKERTGIDITVFDMLGDKVTATSPNNLYFNKMSTDNFSDGIYCDIQKGVCCFLFNSSYNMYMGVINGVNETAKNYAFMISSMIENALFQNEDNPDRKQSLKQILTGEANHTKTKKLIKKFPSLNLPCFALSVSCTVDKQQDVLNFLEQLAGDSNDIAVLSDEDFIAYIRYIESENDYQSALDFAEMIYENIEQELSAKVKIGVGSYAKNAFELSNAFLQGTSAIKLGIITNNKGGIFSYKEFIMMRMIEEIPEATLKKYLDILLDSGAKDILSDNEMLCTAEEFLLNSLNISETSRNLFMHRNTLMYRLDKIEKAMGLNIRRFSDAVTFRIILILYKHLKY